MLWALSAIGILNQQILHEPLYVYGSASQGHTLYQKAVGQKTYLELTGGHKSAIKYRDKVVGVISEFLARIGHS